MFVDPAYARSPEYQEFWAKLKSGEFVAAEFKRIGKGGREVWIQASYNPIFDLNEQVTKVVKFATDVTGRVAAVNQIATGLSRLAEGDLEQRIRRRSSRNSKPLRVDFNASMEALEKSIAAVGGRTRAITAGAGEIAGATDDLVAAHRAAGRQSRGIRRRARRGHGDGEEDRRRAPITRATSSPPPRSTPRRAAQWCARRWRRWRRSTSRRSRSARSSASSTRSPSRPICWRSTPASRRRAPAKPAAASRSSPRKCARSPSARPKRPRRSRASSPLRPPRSIKACVLVGQTGEALERIVSQVVEISGSIAEIAVSAQEQSTGLEQVNTAVTEMDQVTQKNAAMVERGDRRRPRPGRRDRANSPSSSRAIARGEREDEAMRETLKKAAPHAFRAAPEPAPAGRAKPAPTRAPAMKAAVNAPLPASGGQRRRRRLAGILNQRTGRAGRATTSCNRQEAPT